MMHIHRGQHIYKAPIGFSFQKTPDSDFFKGWNVPVPVQKYCETHVEVEAKNKCSVCFLEIVYSSDSLGKIKMNTVVALFNFTCF